MAFSLRSSVGVSFSFLKECFVFRGVFVFFKGIYTLDLLECF